MLSLARFKTNPLQEKFACGERKCGYDLRGVFRSPEVAEELFVFAWSVQWTGVSAMDYFALSDEIRCSECGQPDRRQGQRLDKFVDAWRDLLGVGHEADRRVDPIKALKRIRLSQDLETAIQEDVPIFAAWLLKEILGERSCEQAARDLFMNGLQRAFSEVSITDWRAKQLELPSRIAAGRRRIFTDGPKVRIRFDRDGELRAEIQH